MNQRFLSIPLVSLLTLTVVFGYGVFREIIQDTYQDIVSNSLHQNRQTQELENLEVVYSQDIITLDPFSYNENITNKLNLVYEGLVKFDEHLNIAPALATSWGTLSPTVWDFNLRQNVFFHNLHPFTAEDVVTSLNTLREENNDLSKLLEGIEIQKINDWQIHLITPTPDPTLLAKLTNFYILPHKYLKFQKRDYINQHPIGTGPYQVQSFLPHQNLTLSYFNRYYGSKDLLVHKISFDFIANKYERLAATKKRTVDILASVPMDFANDIKTRGYQLFSLPSLESTFLFFNLQHPLLKQLDVRTAINYSINRPELAQLFNVSLLKEFCPSGVFGFNPDLKTTSYDLTKARTLLQKVTTDKVFLTLNITKSSEKLAQLLADQLALANIKLKINILPDEQSFYEAVKQGTADLYLFTWKFNLADAGEFLNYVIASKGLYNGSHYANHQVDQLISDSNRNLNENSRLQTLQKIMAILEQELPGLPLFETNNNYALKLVENNPLIPFAPKYDGTIL